MLQGDLDANGYSIINLASAPLAADVQTLADILALIGKNFASGSFTVTGTGFAVNPTGLATYVRSGNIIGLSLPELSGASNAAGFTLTGLPAAVVPVHAPNQVVTITDGEGGATDGYGLLQLAAGSPIITLISPVSATGAWTATGTKRLYATSVFDLGI